METNYIKLKKKLIQNINPLEKKYIELAKKFTFEKKHNILIVILLNNMKKIKMVLLLEHL